MYYNLLCFFVLDMDLSDMNTIMDFYLIEFLNFNDCSKDLLHGGITPMDSSNSDIVTLV